MPAVPLHYLSGLTAPFARPTGTVVAGVFIRELTPTIVNEFVKKIIVHAPDKSSGHRRQKIELV